MVDHVALPCVTQLARPAVPHVAAALQGIGSVPGAGPPAELAAAYEYKASKTARIERGIIGVRSRRLIECLMEAPRQYA